LLRSAEHRTESSQMVRLIRLPIRHRYVRPTHAQ
jgi:hypothetical protein